MLIDAPLLQKGKIAVLTGSMRLVCFFETGDERYKWINREVVIASSARCGNQGKSAALADLSGACHTDVDADWSSCIRCLHPQMIL